MREFHCLIADGGSLSEKTRSILCITACEMWQKKLREKVLEGRVSGVVTTELKIATIDAVAGVVFESVVEQNQHPLKVTFMIRLDMLRHTGQRRFVWHHAPPTFGFDTSPHFN